MDRKEKILIVEDEEPIMMGLRENLAVAGYEVVEAITGTEGLAKGIKEKPDLILLDVMMPGMDGVATYRAVREIPEAADTPIVFMTAKSQAHEIEQLLELGALGVISKPFDPIQLSNQVASLWEKNH